MKKNWWKLISMILLVYVAYAGFMNKVPALNILNETIRNLYFHVPMWFGQIIIFTVSIVYAIKYLSSIGKNKMITPAGQSSSMEALHYYDMVSVSCITIGMLYGALGLLTGMIWGNFTWGTPWSSDPKLNATAVGMLIYCAYFVLRGGIDDNEKKARLTAIYAIFSYVLFIVLIFIIPRMREFSIHPGNGGNPGFASYDLDANMRMVFYPAVLGWSLLAVWVMTILLRIKMISYKIESNN